MSPVNGSCRIGVGADVIGGQPILPREPRTSRSQGAEKEARLFETPVRSLCRFAQRCSCVCVYV